MANKTDSIILSASRRTDFIAFHDKQLKIMLEQEYFYQKNDYSKTRKIIEIPKDKIHSIVLWSKDYENLIKNPGILDRYNLFFQFTITGFSNNIERNVPNYKDTVAQMNLLSNKYGADKINWRFDPIGFLNSEAKLKGLSKPGQERLETFKTLCSEISKTGVNRCMVSFMDTKYLKVEARLKRLNLDYYEPTEEEKYLFLEKIVDIANAYGIQIFSCASPFIEKVKGIQKSACIDGNLLEKLYGGRTNHSKDNGQRPDCGCTNSIDLGNYDMGCGHNCTYCYSVACGLR